MRNWNRNSVNLGNKQKLRGWKRNAQRRINNGRFFREANALAKQQPLQNAAGEGKAGR